MKRTLFDQDHENLGGSAHCLVQNKAIFAGAPEILKEIIGRSLGLDGRKMK